MIPQIPDPYPPGLSPTEQYRLDQDLATIREFCQQSAIHSLAEALREREPAVYQPAQIPALSGPVPPLARRERVTVRPVPIDPPPAPRGWWRRHWVHVAFGGGALALGGLVIALVLAIVNAISRAASNVGYAVSSAAPSLGGILLLGLLVLWLISRGGGGKSFSGTFSGRMH